MPDGTAARIVQLIAAPPGWLVRVAPENEAGFDLVAQVICLALVEYRDDGGTHRAIEPVVALSPETGLTPIGLRHPRYLGLAPPAPHAYALEYAAATARDRRRQPETPPAEAKPAP